jgi:hypothetical protein
VPGKVGVAISVLTALVAGIPVGLFYFGGSVWFLVMSLPIFALAGGAFPASVIKLRQERARVK